MNNNKEKVIEFYKLSTEERESEIKKSLGRIKEKYAKLEGSNGEHD